VSSDHFLTPIGQVLDKIFKKSSYKKKFQEAQVVNLWQSIVGPNLFHHTYPVKLDKGILTCRVDSSALLHELQYMKKDIMNKMTSVMKKQIVNNIYFVLGQMPSRITTDK